MLRVGAAYGLAVLDVDITGTAVTVCCHRGAAAVPITSMRLVAHRGLDLTLLARVYRLVERIGARQVGLRAAARVLDEAIRATHPYPRWVATCGSAGLAAALALLLGSPAVAVLVAFVVTAMIDVVGRVLARRRLPSFYRQVVGGFLATAATVGFFALGVLPPSTQPALVVAAGITVLLSGFAVVGTAQDAIGGYHVTAAGRAAEIAMVVGAGAGLLRRIGRVPWGKVPPLVVALAGISPLLPGLTAYRGFYQLSVEGLVDGLVTVTLALAIGLALAAGVTLGQFLTRPNATPLSSADPAPRGERQ